jgi:tripartite-type tricarboxylate transporter receptor subunit TctC
VNGVAAQNYPTRAVTIIVPYAAGGGTDLLARMVGQKLEQRLGKSFVVEDRPGGGTVIAALAVAKAPPDGYTLLMGTSTPLAINATLHRKLPYDPVTEFVPLALIANVPFVLVVNPSLPIRSVRDLIKLAKEKPGSLSYGTRVCSKTNCPDKTGVFRKIPQLRFVVFKNFDWRLCTWASKTDVNRLKSTAEEGF